MIIYDVTLGNVIFSGFVNLKSLSPKLVKADYHGAIITGKMNSLEILYFPTLFLLFLIIFSFKIKMSWLCWLDWNTITRDQECV